MWWYGPVYIYFYASTYISYSLALLPLSQYLWNVCSVAITIFVIYIYKTFFFLLLLLMLLMMMLLLFLLYFVSLACAERRYLPLLVRQCIHYFIPFVIIVVIFSLITSYNIFTAILALCYCCCSYMKKKTKHMQIHHTSVRKRCCGYIEG